MICRKQLIRTFQLLNIARIDYPDTLHFRDNHMKHEEADLHSLCHYLSASQLSYIDLSSEALAFRLPTFRHASSFRRRAPGFYRESNFGSSYATLRDSRCLWMISEYWNDEPPFRHSVLLHVFIGTEFRTSPAQSCLPNVCF